MPDDKDIIDPELEGEEELKPVVPIAEEDDHESLDELADAELGADEDDEEVVEPAFSDDD